MLPISAQQSWLLPDRINVSVLRAKYSQVLVGHSNIIDAPKAKDPKVKDPKAKDPKAKDPKAKDPKAKDQEVPDTII